MDYILEFRWASQAHRYITFAVSCLIIVDPIYSISVVCAFHEVSKLHFNHLGHDAYNSELLIPSYQMQIGKICWVWAKGRTKYPRFQLTAFAVNRTLAYKKVKSSVFEGLSQKIPLKSFFWNEKGFDQLV